MPDLYKALLLMMFAASALAQDESDYQPPVRYEVELIIFRHLDQSRNTPEIPTEESFIKDSPLSLNPVEEAANPFIGSLQAPSDAETLSPIDPLDDPRETTAADPKIGFYLMDPDTEFPDFVPLPNASLKLGREVRRLQTLDAYQPVLHIGWIQSASGASEAVPYRLSFRDGQFNDLSGSVTLYKERYLHLELDLSLRPAPDEYGAGSEVYSRDIVDQMRLAGRRLHKLAEARRVGAQSSHYFDHPLFGVIARISRIVVETDDPAGSG